METSTDEGISAICTHSQKRQVGMLLILVRGFGSMAFGIPERCRHIRSDNLGSERSPHGVLFLVVRLQLHSPRKLDGPLLAA